MVADPISVLLVAESASDALLCRQSLAETDSEVAVVHVGRLSDAMEWLATSSADAVLLDLFLPDSEGLATFARLHAVTAEIPIVVLSSEVDETLALKAVASGAQDYLLRRHLNGTALSRTLRYAVEKRRLAEEMKQQAEAFRAVYENAPVGIVNADAQGKLIRCNPAFERMLGYDDEGLSGISTYALTHPDDIGATRQAYAALESGAVDTVRVEKRYLRRDGSAVWAHVSASAVRDRSGALRFTVSMIENITDRRESERAVRASEERFRSLSTCSPVGIFVTDLDGEATYLNPRVEEICGFTMRQGLGNGWRQFLHPDSRDAVLAGWDRKVPAGSEFEGRVRWLHPQSGDRWTHVRAAPLRSDDGSPVGYVGTVEDITERMRVERALKTSEQYFRALIEHAHDIIVVLDSSGCISYCSPSLERVLGYSPHEVQGRNVFEFIHPDDQEKMRHSFTSRSTAEGRGSFVEFRLMARDGSWRVLEEVGTNLFADPAVGGMVINARDVTERKQADAALAAAETHYRRLVQTSPIVIFAIDSEGRVTEINPAGEAVFGHPAERLVGSAVSDFIPPEFAPQADAMFASLFTGQRDRIEVDVTVLHSSGERRVLRVDAATIWEDERAVGAHGVARDVTEDYRRERQMRLLATALEGLGMEGVSVLDESGKHLYANTAHARLLGYDPAVLGSLRQDDFLPDEESRREMEAMYAELERVESWRGRVRRKRLSDGQVLTLDLSVGRVQDGTRTRYFTIIQDATENILRERQLRRAERLASVGTLVSGVAHELNNPLHAIANFADLMMLEERSADDQEALDIIHREARRAGRIVNDLRMLARRSQSEEGDRELVDVNDVLRHILKTRHYTLNTHNVQVREELAAAPVLMRGDQAQLEQVILNLIVNAEQAMEGQDRPRVLTVRSRVAGESVTLSISDTGSGIPRDHLDRIFDPFWTTKPPGQGTGLGLSLVHSIVTEHGGSVRVQSSVGVGTEILVTLPVATVGEPDDPKAQHAESDAAALRILVMDDEPANRRVLVRFLAKRGHQVSEAAQGTEALRLIEEAHFDIIVSDVRMPGMGGLEFLERIRAIDAALVTRLIFLTGDTNSPEVERLSREENIPVLFKPVSLPVLAAAIEQKR